MAVNVLMSEAIKFPRMYPMVETGDMSPELHLFLRDHPGSSNKYH